MNPYLEMTDASNKISVKVVASAVYVTRVGDEKDFFIELTNDSAYSMDISRWKLISDTKIFNIPKNTTIQSKAKIIFSPKITHFGIEDKSSLKLLDPEGAILDDVSEIVPEIPKVEPEEKSTEIIMEKSSSTEESPEIVPEPEINLAGSIILSEEKGGEEVLVEEKEYENRNLYIPTALFVIFLGVAASGVYFIRKRKFFWQKISPGSDFEILDE